VRSDFAPPDHVWRVRHVCVLHADVGPLAPQPLQRVDARRLPVFCVKEKARSFRVEDTHHDEVRYEDDAVEDAEAFS
jgi:hypothetical protein